MELSTRCVNRLALVHPDLRRVIVAAADIYSGQFIVTEGDRTLARQKELFDAKASKTMRSRHVKGSNACGISCAVDLAVKVGSEVRWDGELYIILAEVVAVAAAREKVEVDWGGCWCQIKPGMDLGAAQADYATRKRAEGGRPLIDGPHFQLPWGVYP